MMLLVRSSDKGIGFLGGGPDGGPSGLFLNIEFKVIDGQTCGAAVHFETLGPAYSGIAGHAFACDGLFVYFPNLAGSECGCGCLGRMYILTPVVFCILILTLASVTQALLLVRLLSTKERGKWMTERAAVLLGTGGLVRYRLPSQGRDVIVVDR